MPRRRYDDGGSDEEQISGAARRSRMGRRNLARNAIAAMPDWRKILNTDLMQEAMRK
jgi:hypothetical protein